MLAHDAKKLTEEQFHVYKMSGNILTFLKEFKVNIEGIA